ncbi:hypothetical protein CFC21_111598 [Triticum aestivum]|uniref:F-box domain-containing protein n=3 Tax=Triticinae TaxID=1648030 RepID=A0A3B6TZ68_WHEAT|nr:uncharacterized protein LOC109768363 [Aegilops tauschii subsp. strangulata]XP_044439458.1 uncharacterized protein LOC123165790 [Triticum aestivum]KAF7111608.1 hypothetical protein CFC21_111598 [Triticum aestivum]
MDSIPIPDVLLEEIFLRLPAPDTLVRASATCTTFCRVIKGRAFRRRFHALHRPPLLGFMDAAGFHPAEAPHPSAPLAGALTPCAADFSFVPAVVSSSSYYKKDDGKGPRWRPRDVRGGRVLLDWISLHPRFIKSWSYHYGSDISILVDISDVLGRGPHHTWTKRDMCNAADFHLAVCDPLSRGFMLLPTIPEDLAALPQDRLGAFEPVLAPATGDEPFKVICVARYETKLVIFVFPSTTMQWCMVESPVVPSWHVMSCFDCVGSCFYWTDRYDWTDHLMVLDTRTLRFSTVNFLTGYHMELRDADLSIGHDWRPNAVVVGSEGAIEMFSLVPQHGSFALHHTSLQPGQDSTHEWKLEKIVQLPRQGHGYSISTVGAAEGFLFFQDIPAGHELENFDCYSMEVKTYEIIKVCTKDFFDSARAHPYFSFPPVLSEPTV